MLPTPGSRTFIAGLIYAALLLDNILLTVIVPILPDYLAALHAQAADRTAHAIAQIVPLSLLDASIGLHYVPTVQPQQQPHGNGTTTATASIWRADSGRLSDENGAIGVLLAAKALVQLAVTPFVGNFAQRLGYRLLIVMGTGCLLVAAVVFAVGSTYAMLIVARALQGIASACIGVCGMSLVAQLYPEVERRSRVMGVILGSVALGVLVGYPFGGIMYDVAGKAMPFWLLAGLVAVCFVLQICTMDLYAELEADFIAVAPTALAQSTTTEYARCVHLLGQRTVRLVIAAIWLSTSAMAILEPCLPVWLMENLHPKRWQVGTVFVPDSVGYFLGTNFFAARALRLGQLRVAVVCLLAVGVSCFAIPNTTSVLGLLLPHFTLGLGIGILDAALVPLLATLVDDDFCRQADTADGEACVGDATTITMLDEVGSETSGGVANYGLVYAVQQMAVSLAYAMAPLMGGLFAQYISFGWLMSLVGGANCAYALLMLLVMVRRPNAALSDGEAWVEEEEQELQHTKMMKTTTTTNHGGMLEWNDTPLSKDYRRFYDSMELRAQ